MGAESVARCFLRTLINTDRRGQKRIDVDLYKSDIGKRVRRWGQDDKGQPELKTDILESFHRWDSGITSVGFFNGNGTIIGVSSEIVEILDT